MNDTNRLIAQSAVRVSPDRFTWMKYKGLKNKILTHTKRNGEIIRTRLVPGDVYGYRKFKKKGVEFALIQVVLKSDNMDLTYNLKEKTFNTALLKVSRATVMPKKFKKDIDITAIDKKAKQVVVEQKPKVVRTRPKKKTERDILIERLDKDLVKIIDQLTDKFGQDMMTEDSLAAIEGAAKKLNTSTIQLASTMLYYEGNDLVGAVKHAVSVESSYDLLKGNSFMEEVRKDLGSDVLNFINGLKLPDGIGEKLEGVHPQFRVKMVDGNPTVYLVVYDPNIIKTTKIAELVKRFRDLGTSGLYQTVIANCFSHIYVALSEQFGLASRTFKAENSLETKLIRSRAHEGHRYLRVLLGTLDSNEVFNTEPEVVDNAIVDLGDGYTYTQTPDGNGELAKYLTPEVLKQAHVIVWSTDPSTIKPRMQKIKEIHQTSPFLKMRWASKWGEVTDVFLDDGPRPDEPGSEMYGVVYSDNSLRRIYGKDFEKTVKQQELESTPEYQEAQEAERDARERRNQENIRILQEEQAKRDAVQARIREWLSETSISTLQQGKIVAVLSQPIRYSGTINGILTREEFVRSMVLEFNAEASTREEPMYKRPSRSRWNRMNAYEQEEVERKLRLGQTKTIHQLGNYDVTKYEYLYAIYLGA